MEAMDDQKWLTHAQWYVEWFLRRDDRNALFYDHKTGRCCDGLNADGPNRNQGVEPTLLHVFCPSSI
jgi:hypothetical protein